MSMSNRRRVRGSFAARHTTNEARFPAPVMVNNCYFFTRASIENYKRQLAGFPPLAADPSAPVELVKLATVARELGRHPLTVKRAIAASEPKPEPAPVKRRARSAVAAE